MKKMLLIYQCSNQYRDVSNVLNKVHFRIHLVCKILKGLFNWNIAMCTGRSELLQFWKWS